ncbi:N-acetylglutaminylglutamine amidotransferase [Sulfurivirga sp.]|uniref:N-acetylglutaminylglutamine amidotransferase n=1 Tax=Sulfurivirga sp. TaxID=2614236 RepID=UPI0025F5F043|nr:N-acetylglutaminylglutamine amidotransferase [Sulfurivirga sp.]
MCGICGSVHWDGRAADVARLRPMLEALARRGPDDEGIWQQRQVALGHRRLAIIDLSPAGHQPMVDGELTLAFNGCIYNWQALRAELEALGHVFRSHSDTEVILKAFRQWGIDCLSRLDGMFAFALWDDHQQQLWLARDRFGIKPLYYAPVEGGLLFASNVQALLATGEVDTGIDPVGLHHQLTLHGVVPAPHTILKGVRKLPPAHWMLMQPNGELITRRWWQLDARRPDPLPDEAEWVEIIREHLQQAVRERMQAADVPVGVLLSGGIDSSLIVGLLAEAGAEDLRTFTIGFEDAPEEKGSEFEYADAVAQHFGTRHEKFLIPNEAALARLPEAVRAMSEPMFGQDAIGFYLLAEQVSRHVKVVQTGQGADEVFAGYFWYPLMQAAEGEPIERFAPHYFDRTHEEWLETVADRYHIEDVTRALVEQALDMPGADTFMDQVLRFDVTTLIVDDPVKRVDNMTMAWGLEARVPFLDYQLVEKAFELPPELKLRDGGKYILKRIARGLLPDKVVDRPKVAFPMPALKYVRGEFYAFMREILTSERARQRGLFNPAYVEKLLREPEADWAYTAIQGSKLWQLALLELWLQQVVDGIAW